MKKFSFLVIVALPLLLAACGEGTGLAVIEGSSVAGAWLTSPWTPDPADTQSQIAEHENWCYSTLGYSECYSEPQDTQPSRLINVDPQNRYPLNGRSYNEAVMHTR